MQCESGRRRATRETLQQQMITMLRKMTPESRTSSVSYNKILNLEHQVFERERYLKKDPIVKGREVGTSKNLVACNKSASHTDGMRSM